MLSLGVGIVLLLLLLLLLLFVCVCACVCMCVYMHLCGCGCYYIYCYYYLCYIFLLYIITLIVFLEVRYGDHLTIFITKNGFHAPSNGLRSNLWCKDIKNASGDNGPQHGDCI